MFKTRKKTPTTASKFLSAAASLAALSAFLTLATGCSEKPTLWIYTSLYKETIAEIEPELQRAFPDAKIQWYQGGSEIVAGKVNTEMAAGGTKADILLTSDPFWYLELKQNGQLLPYDSPAAAQVPKEYSDPDFAFTCNRIPVMVMAYHSGVFADGSNPPPTAWKDLTKPQWKDKISIGSPLESGTSFTAVAMLARVSGWDYFKSLRENNLVSAGGNSSVVTRVETRERPVGIVLLENVLKAQEKGSPVRPIYPSDGVIAIPSPIAILKSSKQPELAKKVFDWFFSETAQNAIIKSGMYSPIPSFPSPKGALPWPELQGRMMKWNPTVLKEILSERESIKKKFSEVVLR